LYNRAYFDQIIDTRNDNEGRICSLTALKNDNVYNYVNVYAPNDHYKAIKFYEEVEEWVKETINKHPTATIIISGDFNFVFSQENDSIGRQTKKQEEILAKCVKRFMNRYGFIDSYRSIHQWGGFTWGRDNPTIIRSRLDHILIKDNMSQNILQSYTNKAPNESDHLLVYTEIEIEEMKFGPGIQRCNSELLNNAEILNRVDKKLQEHMSEMPKDWNPHQKLDYIKMHTRNILLAEGKMKAKQDKIEIDFYNQELDTLNKKQEKLLIAANNKQGDVNELINEIDKIKEAIDMLECMIEPCKDRLTKKLIFRSRVKWAEEGEKSNKYFLNTLKERQKRLQIRKIIANGRIHNTQTDIEKAIHKFYKELYAKEETKDIKKDENQMFKDLPKISSESKNKMKQKLTKEEMKNSLFTCKESAPGPDGITYGVYKKLWNIFGDLIYNAWEYSNDIGKLAPTQRDAVINLLEKKGKDKTKIENLRPISLSNCDIKICTKAIALRTNGV
jgi:hypothetical protein